MRKVFTLACLLLTLHVTLQASSGSSYKISDFTGGYFKIVSKEQGIYNLDIGFKGVIGKNERPAAYGNLNNSGKTDIVTVSNDNQTIRVYSYDADTETFTNTSVVTSDHFAGGNILSVALIDMNNDKMSDMVVTVTPQVSSQLASIYTFKRTGNDYIIHNDYTVRDIRKQQPFLFTLYDKQQDPKLGVTYQTYMLLDDVDAKRSLWFVDKANDKIKQIPWDSILNKGTGCTIPNLPSGKEDLLMDSDLGSSFVDMNADCRPDMLLQSVGDKGKVQEFYMYTNDGFCLVSKQYMPSSWTMPSFFDMNNRGTNDMVIAEQKTSNNNARIRVMRNKYSTNLENDLCKTNQDNVGFPYPGYTETASSDNTFVYDLDTGKSGYDYLYEDISKSYLPPITQLADIDLDGYTDLALVMAKGDKSDASNTLVKVWMGEKCKEEGQAVVFPNGGTNDQLNSCRYFNYTTFEDSKPALDKSTWTSSNTLRTSFFDFGELGAFSMLSQVWDPQTQTTSIHTYFNFMNKNNYFLKSMARTHGRSNGNTYIGLNYLAVRTEMDGKNNPVSFPQQYGMSHNRLQLPYVIFGLGRINNYIQDFTAGVTWANKDYYHSWSPIIPNSQLITTPPLGNSDWKIEIYINPTKAMALIIISTLIVLFIIGVIIIIYHIKEKEQDKKENENAIFMPF